MKKSTIIAACLLIISITITMLMISGCGQPEKTIVKVGYMPIVSNLPLWVAMEKGYFEKEGLKIETIPFKTSNEMLEALIAGQIDATTDCAITAIYSVEAQSPKSLIIYSAGAMSDEYPVDAIVVRKNSSITSLSMLKGKTIGTFPGSQFMIYTELILKNYLDPKKDIKVIQLPPPVQIEALMNNQVDALFTLEPYITMATQKDIGKILVETPVSKYIMNPFPGGASVVLRIMEEKYPNSLKKFVKAMDKALDDIRNEPDAYRYLLPKYTTLTEDITSKVVFNAWYKSSEVPIDNFQKAADLVLEHKIIAQKIDVALMVYKK